MKYIVRWEIEGFITREEFKTKREALKYYDKIIDNFGYFTKIDIIEVK